MPLVKRHQLLEFRDFYDVTKTFDSHMMFLSGRKFGALQSVSDEKRTNLWNKFDEAAMLPGTDNLSEIHKPSLFYLIFIFKFIFIKIILSGTEYCKECLIAIGCKINPLIPLFGSVA